MRTRTNDPETATLRDWVIAAVAVPAIVVGIPALVDGIVRAVNP